MSTSGVPGDELGRVLRQGRVLRDGAEAALAAGGSLLRGDDARLPRLARRIWLVAELLLFYVGAPLAIAYVIATFHVPLFLALQPVLIGFILYLLWDDTFLVRRELSIGFRLRTALWIVLLFLVLGSLIALATWWRFPHMFLSFPRFNPQLWMFVMIAYPIMSVIPQELVFRTFFFHRYGPLFGHQRWAAILVNGALFGFAHIIFGNAYAVIGTAVAGVLFAYRYETTRSFWAVCLEHSLYGWLVFTIGLGRFFFTGVSSLN